MGATRDTSNHSLFTCFCTILDCVQSCAHVIFYIFPLGCWCWLLWGLLFISTFCYACSLVAHADGWTWPVFRQDQGRPTSYLRTTYCVSCYYALQAAEEIGSWKGTAACRPREFGGTPSDEQIATVCFCSVCKGVGVSMDRMCRSKTSARVEEAVCWYGYGSPPRAPPPCLPGVRASLFPSLRS